MEDLLENHVDLTWEEFNQLPQEEKDNGTIYFITDIDSKIEIMEELLNKAIYIKNKLDQLT